MTGRAWSLGGALLASLGLLMLAVSAAAGFFVYGLVEASLVRQSITEASTAVRAAAGHLTAEQGARATRPLSEDLADLATGNTYVLLTTAAGRFVLSKGPPPPVMPMNGWVRSPGRGWLQGQGTAYAYARSTAVLRGRRLALVVVMQERALSRVLAVLRSTLLLAGGLLMGALLAGALLVVGTVTRPLRTLRRFADQAAGDGVLDTGALPPASGLAEVDALTTALRRMLDRLLAASDRERQFSGQVAHALRTPVQVIGGYLTTLGGWGQRDPAVRRQALAALRREAAGMEALIQSLLTLFQAGTQTVASLEPVDVAVLLDRLRPDLRDACPNHPLTVEAPGRPVALADVGLLTAVLRTLVENADAYAIPASEVRIAASRQGGRVEIAVVNQGPAIPDEVRAHLFERFYRGQQAATTEHVGLGLAIADAMVDKMGATWRVACEFGNVVFAVLLPAA